MIPFTRSFIWAWRNSQGSGLCPSATVDLHIPSRQFSLRVGLQPDGCWGVCSQTFKVYPLWEYPIKWRRSATFLPLLFTVLFRCLHRVASQCSPAWLQFIKGYFYHCMFLMIRVKCFKGTYQPNFLISLLRILNITKNLPSKRGD